jgi:hypothetical protein
MVVVDIGVYTYRRIATTGQTDGASALTRLTEETVGHVAGMVAFTAVQVACIRIYANPVTPDAVTGCAANSTDAGAAIETFVTA